MKVDLTSEFQQTGDSPNALPPSPDYLIGAYYDDILKFAYQYLGNVEDAREVTQETFLKVTLALSTPRIINNERAWIYAIARNLCADRKRSWRRFLDFLDRRNISAASLTPSSNGSSDLSLIIRQLVNRLPPRQREVFILRHWHDFSTTETANLLEVDAGTVKSHLSRAVATLKKALLSDHHESLFDQEG